MTADWAGQDTSGDVVLIDPAGGISQIGSWKASDTLPTVSENEIDNLAGREKAREAVVDITKRIAGPGTYHIRFQYTGGRNAAVIWGVQAEVQ